MRAAGYSIDQKSLYEIVRNDDKRRYALSADRRRVRASQGHSIAVDLKLTASVPPNTIYHGTLRSGLQEIRKTGIQRQRQLYVHLSPDIPTAMNVGERRGAAVVLPIKAALMQDQGYKFFQSEDQVWLTDHVADRSVLSLASTVCLFQTIRGTIA